MKRKLFFKEFMEKRRFAAFIFIVLTISFLISGFEYISFAASLDSGYKPDVFLNGTASANVFEYYCDIGQTEEYINTNSHGDIRVVPCVTRNLVSCAERNRFNTVSYTVKGYSQEHINDYLAKYVSVGRTPAAGKNEVMIGSRFAQVMKLSIGDKINAQTVQIGTVGEIALVISLDSIPELLPEYEYTVTGIISEDCSYLECSAVTVIDDDVEPNTAELFFQSKGAEKTYLSLVDGLPDEVGGINEFYSQKKNDTVSLIVNLSLIHI